MKQYFTGFFTGACLVASAVMFMGQRSYNIGEFQMSSKEDFLYLLNTKSGILYWRNPHWKTEGITTPKWIDTKTTFLTKDELIKSELERNKIKNNENNDGDDDW